MIDLDTIFEPEDLHPDLATTCTRRMAGRCCDTRSSTRCPTSRPPIRHCNLVYGPEASRTSRGEGRARLERRPGDVRGALPARCASRPRRGDHRTAGLLGHVRDIWSRTELPNLQFEKWLAVWTAADSPSLVPHRRAAMRPPRDQAILQPPAGDRGVARRGPRGMGRGRAVVVPRSRNGGMVRVALPGRRSPPPALAATIARADVFALLLDRNEWEIVAEPDCVTVQEIYDAPRTIKKPDPLWKFAKKRHKF